MQNTLREYYPNFHLVSDKDCFDLGTNTPYRATEWEHEGHKIEVNVDEYGYHARIDEGPAEVNMDEAEFIAWMFENFAGE